VCVHMQKTNEGGDLRREDVVRCFAFARWGGAGEMVDVRGRSVRWIRIYTMARGRALSVWGGLPSRERGRWCGQDGG